MSQELVRRPQPTLEETYRIAKGFAMSGYFQDVQSAEQALVKIMAGGEMGLLPFQSMNGIDIIKGKPVLKPALLRGLLDNNDAYDYEITWEDDACTVTVYKNGKKRGDSRFSMDDARKAGLAGKENYQKFERNMLLERATSNGVRWYAPGLTMGPAYVTGELTPDAPGPVPSLPVVTATVVNESDLPWLPEDASATPAGRIPAESPVIPGEGQTVAPADEPAAVPGAGGGLIETLADAQKFIRPLQNEQIGVMKQMLDIKGTTTKREMAELLLAQREGWDPQDILAEMAGWA